MCEFTTELFYKAHFQIYELIIKSGLRCVWLQHVTCSLGLFLHTQYLLMLIFTICYARLFTFRCTNIQKGPIAGYWKTVTLSFNDNANKFRFSTFCTKTPIRSIKTTPQLVFICNTFLQILKWNIFQIIVGFFYCLLKLILRNVKEVR